jgi:hypothetical protein
VLCRDMLTVGELIYCSWYERQTFVLPTQKLKMSAFAVACSERVHYTSAFILRSSNLPFATKTCEHAHQSHFGQLLSLVL